MRSCICNSTKFFHRRRISSSKDKSLQKNIGSQALKNRLLTLESGLAHCLQRLPRNLTTHLSEGKICVVCRSFSPVPFASSFFASTRIILTDCAGSPILPSITYCNLATMVLTLTLPDSYGYVVLGCCFVSSRCVCTLLIAAAG